MMDFYEITNELKENRKVQKQTVDGLERVANAIEELVDTQKEIAVAQQETAEVMGNSLSGFSGTKYLGNDDR